MLVRITRLVRTIRFMLPSRARASWSISLRAPLPCSSECRFAAVLFTAFKKGNASAATGDAHRDSNVGRFVGGEVSALSPDGGDVRHRISASSILTFTRAGKTRFNVRSHQASSMSAPMSVLPTRGYSRGEDGVVLTQEDAYAKSLVSVDGNRTRYACVNGAGAGRNRGRPSGGETAHRAST